jgi:hypothetical protein
LVTYLVTLEAARPEMYVALRKDTLDVRPYLDLLNRIDDDWIVGMVGSALLARTSDERSRVARAEGRTTWGTAGSLAEDYERAAKYLSVYQQRGHMGALRWTMERLDFARAFRDPREA